MVKPENISCKTNISCSLLYICFAVLLFQEACNKELEWFKSVKETQGSVEVTSIGQMNNILKNGCYFIGSSRPEVHQNSSEIISLKLKEKDKESRILKKQYTLEELHDLESKLVLITGSKAEYRNEVDYFLGVSSFDFFFFQCNMKFIF